MAARLPGTTRAERIRRGPPENFGGLPARRSFRAGPLPPPTNHLYGETICLTDGTLTQAQSNTARPEVQPFVFGGTSQGINMPDNIAFQPRTGNTVLHEDAETTFEGPHNNDLWDCLPDGPDQDLLTDGCARIATLNDLTAEWTGGAPPQEVRRFGQQPTTR